MEPTKYLTPPGVAKILGCNADKVRALIESGQLDAIDTSINSDTGRPRWRIEPAAFERFKVARSNTGRGGAT